MEKGKHNQLQDDSSAKPGRQHTDLGLTSLTWESDPGCEGTNVLKMEKEVFMSEPIKFEHTRLPQSKFVDVDLRGSLFDDVNCFAQVAIGQIGQ